MKSIHFSIIIPVYNDAEDLNFVLQALENQIYPKDKYEVIVVDNGSTDNTISVAKQFESVKLLHENNYPASPYSCRNRGIEIAKGEYLIFLDASCIPVHDWLQSFKGSFEKTNADLIGGKVTFRFMGDKPTASEYLDSITNIRMKETIELKNAAKTANLAVKKEVIDKVGMFDEGIRSGGDLMWTKKATDMGFKIDYSENAEVKKKARIYSELLNKQWRVAKAQPAIFISKGRNIGYLSLILNFLFTIIKSIIRFFCSILKTLYKKILFGRRYEPKCKNEIFGIAFVHSYVSILMRLGNIYGYYQLKSKKLSN